MMYAKHINENPDVLYTHTNLGKTPAGQAQLYLVIFIGSTFCGTTLVCLYRRLNMGPYTAKIW